MKGLALVMAENKVTSGWHFEDGLATRKLQSTPSNDQVSEMYHRAQLQCANVGDVTGTFYVNHATR